MWRREKRKRDARAEENIEIVGEGEEGQITYA